MSKTHDRSRRSDSAADESTDRPHRDESDPVHRLERGPDEVNSWVSHVDVPRSDAGVDDQVSGEGDEVCDGMLAPTLVRASAGTGKTYRLTARLLRILLQGAAPDSILATTFTRKAAGEILDRLLLSLARAADETDDRALEELREQVGIPTLPRSVCLQLLGSLLRNTHRLRVCTLDSLFAQLARSFPFELGLPPAWRLTDEIEETWFREQAVDSVISMLQPAQMTALLSMLGKGETKRSIARELLQVVDTAYASQRQCGAEAWSKLSAPRLPEEADIRAAAGTMRMAKPRQRRHQDKLCRLAEDLELRQFGILVDDTLVSNIALARRMRSEVKYYRAPFPEGLDESFDVLYAAAKSTALSLLQAQNEATGLVLSAYDEQVMRLKEADRALGFDDLSIRLASQFASLDQRLLSNRMDGAIDHILLDEFQDTSPAQWQVLRPFAARATALERDADPAEPEPPALAAGPGSTALATDSEPTALAAGGANDASSPQPPAANASTGAEEDRQVKRSFFCVGDTKQAIYGWRGGVAEIFDAVADQLPGVIQVKQNKSYRSSPIVLDVVNQTFQNLPRHPLAAAAQSRDPTDKAMYEAAAVVPFARRFPRHEAEKKSLAGYVRFETARRITGDGEERRLACFEDASRIVAEINAAAPSNSIGVLTRTNRGVAQLIYLLEKLGVEVSQEGGNPLTDSAAVEVVLSALMMAEHPGDGRWSFHVGNTPLAKIPGFGADWVRALVEEQGISEAVELLAGTLAPGCNPRETLRLKQLTQLAISYELHPAPRLRDFVRLVREKRVERPQAAPVRVMTVHQAKGLEFDAVVLPELDAPLTRQAGNCVADVRELGEPPRGMSRYLNHKSWHFLPEHWQRAFGQQAAAAMTEALCLLYVAMTRSRQALHLVIQPPRRSDFENRTAASLLFHALGCDQDPSQGSTTLFEAGDSKWYGEAGEQEKRKTVGSTRQVTINFRPDALVPEEQGSNS